LNLFADIINYKPCECSLYPLEVSALGGNQMITAVHMQWIQIKTMQCVGTMYHFCIFTHLMRLCVGCVS